MSEAESIKAGASVAVRDAATGRFLAGHPGNPKGRPPAGYAMTDILRRYLDLPLAKLLKINLGAVPAKDAVAIRTILEAVSGPGIGDRHYIYDRLDGKPKHADDGGLPGSNLLFLGPIGTVLLGVPDGHAPDGGPTPPLPRLSN